MTPVAVSDTKRSCDFRQRGLAPCRWRDLRQVFMSAADTAMVIAISERTPAAFVR